MAWVTFTCSGTLFGTKLADNAVANGWARCEAGYDWIKPSGSNNVCLGRITQISPIRIYTEVGATGQLYTIYEPAVKESYEAGSTHAGVGLGWIGWGNPIYWAMRGENDTARDFTFEGWMDSNCIFGNVKPDSSITGATTFPIFFCVTKGFDGINRLVGLDMCPQGAAYRCNQRLIYATDSLNYFKGLQCGGLGVWAFDNKARLSKLYFFRGGVLVADVVNAAAILGSFEDPVSGVPYVLCSKSQGVEVYNDECILTIGGTDYYYRCLYPTLTPPHNIMLCNKSSNFNAIVAPSAKGVDEIITYWVRRA
jgi:hypothetical protein